LDAKNQSNNSVERSVSISSNSASTSFSGLDATVFDAKLAVAGVDVPNLDVDFTIEEAKALPGRNVVADIAVDSSVDPTTANVQINTVDIDEIVEEDNLSHPDTADIKTEIGSLNQTMLQAFYWEMDTGSYESNYPGEANLWRLIESRADDLSDVGITSLLK
jgi:copper chaperone CopZ